MLVNVPPHISHCRSDGLLGLGLGVCLLRAAGGGAGGRRGAAAVRHGGGRGVHRPLVPRHHGPALLHVSTPACFIDVLFFSYIVDYFLPHRVRFLTLFSLAECFENENYVLQELTVPCFVMIHLSMIHFNLIFNCTSGQLIIHDGHL